MFRVIDHFSESRFPFRRLCAALTLFVSLVVPTQALADATTANALRVNLIDPANEALKAELRDRHSKREVSQANPVGTPQKPLRRPGLPQRFTFNIDGSIAAPTNDVGFDANDPGGVDAGFGIGISRTNRFQAGYYEIQQVPIGFSNTRVPFYVQGLTGPGTSIPQTQAYQNTGVLNVVTKDKILTVLDQNLILLAGKFPIVISPTYLSHTANVGGYGDRQLIEVNGLPTVVHTRTEQEYLLPVTIPFLASPRFFGTLTVAPQWLVHRAGANETNHAQIFELAYIEYRANPQTTLFFQPSRLIQYDPINAYPQYTPSFIVGLSHRFTKLAYVQITSLEGGPTNYRPGITALTCQRLPCAPSQVAPTIGGFKASTIQVQFGIGSPTVVPL